MCIDEQIINIIPMLMYVFIQDRGANRYFKNVCYLFDIEYRD